MKQIFFDEKQYDSRTRLIEDAVNFMNAAIKGFNALGVAKMTETLFRLAVKADWIELEHLLVKSVAKELDAKGITMAAFRRNIIDETLDDFRTNVQPLFSGLKQFTQDAPSMGYRNLLPYLDYKVEEVVFTGRGKQLLKEELTTSLTTKEAEALYSLQQELAPKIERLALLIGIPLWQLPAHLFGAIFQITSDEKIKPRLLNYSAAKSLPAV
jgi:hypothetical protein